MKQKIESKNYSGNKITLLNERRTDRMKRNEALVLIAIIIVAILALGILVSQPIERTSNYYPNKVVSFPAKLGVDKDVFGNCFNELGKIVKCES